MDESSHTPEPDISVRRSPRWSRLLLWLAALGLTYSAGRLAVDVVKWVVLMYWAPTVDAKLILVNYLLGAFVPVLLLGLPAVWAWIRLFRSGERLEVGLILLLELASVAFVDFRPVQDALANYVN